MENNVKNLFELAKEKHYSGAIKLVHTVQSKDASFDELVQLHKHGGSYYERNLARRIALKNFPDSLNLEILCEFEQSGDSEVREMCLKLIKAKDKDLYFLKKFRRGGI